MRFVPRRVVRAWWGAWCLVLALAAGGVAAAAATAPGAVVTYDGISAAQAQGLAEVLSAAREVYSNDFAADVPATVTLVVRCGPGNATRLYTDGRDRVFLSIASPAALAPPRKSGAFHLYGLCHEVAHVAMYRTLKDRDWMTTAAAEGWAHFAGSVVVDRVYAAKGEKIWPEPYDYRADGTARLAQQLAVKTPDEVVRGAGQWQALDAIVGRANLAKVFAAWQAAGVDPAKPDETLLPALLSVALDKADALKAWYAEASPLLVRARPASGFAKVESPPAKLEGKPVTLAGDDDAADGKRSIAGGGHARLFKAPAEGGEWYLRAVSIHGARYGPPAPPADETFDVALCDEQMRVVALWKQPYKLFDRGPAKWVRIELPTPTRVPADFHACVAFRPTAQSGVFVSSDASTSGNSRVATPGELGSVLKQGDWMIRAEVDRPRAADALRGE